MVKKPTKHDKVLADFLKDYPADKWHIGTVDKEKQSHLSSARMPDGKRIRYPADVYRVLVVVRQDQNNPAITDADLERAFFVDGAINKVLSMKATSPDIVEAQNIVKKWKLLQDVSRDALADESFLQLTSSIIEGIERAIEHNDRAKALNYANKYRETVPEAEWPPILTDCFKIYGL